MWRNILLKNTSSTLRAVYSKSNPYSSVIPQMGPHLVPLDWRNQAPACLLCIDYPQYTSLNQLIPYYIFYTYNCSDLNVQNTSSGAVLESLHKVVNVGRDSRVVCIVIDSCFSKVIPINPADWRRFSAELKRNCESSLIAQSSIGCFVSCLRCIQVDVLCMVFSGCVWVQWTTAGCSAVWQQRQGHDCQFCSWFAFGFWRSQLFCCWFVVQRTTTVSGRTTIGSQGIDLHLVVGN